MPTDDSLDSSSTELPRVPGPGREELRRHPRFKVESSSARFCAGGLLSRLGLVFRWTEGQTVNLSEGGVLIHSREPMKKGAEVRVRIDVPKYSDRIESPGRVQWCYPSARQEGHFYIGVQFTGLSAPESKKVAVMRQVFTSEEYRAKTAKKRRPPEITLLG